MKVLDFDLQELHELEPFVKWAGLSTASISWMVRETSVLNTGEDWRVSEWQFDIRRRTHRLVGYLHNTLSSPGCPFDPTKRDANTGAKLA